MLPHNTACPTAVILAGVNDAHRLPAMMVRGELTGKLQHANEDYITSQLQQTVLLPTAASSFEEEAGKEGNNCLPPVCILVLAEKLMSMLSLSAYGKIPYSDINLSQKCNGYMAGRIL
ncbi:MAG: hypothetical protein ABI325_12645 [Ginsengibacter sp.]